MIERYILQGLFYSITIFIGIKVFQGYGLGWHCFVKPKKTGWLNRITILIEEICLILISIIITIYWK